MITTTFGEIVLNHDDIFDLAMQGRPIESMTDLLVDSSVDLAQLQKQLDGLGAVATWKSFKDFNVSLDEFDKIQQSNWHMPQQYKDLDIAEHVLNLCQSEAELQRCGQELLLYNEFGLLDLLRYLKYLVDTMRDHRIIWGVGRGSSVASFVLYKLDVHKINSLYYDLDYTEFLR